MLVNELIGLSVFLPSYFAPILPKYFAIDETLSSSSTTSSFTVTRFVVFLFNISKSIIHLLLLFFFLIKNMFLKRKMSPPPHTIVTKISLYMT